MDICEKREHKVERKTRSLAAKRKRERERREGRGYCGIRTTKAALTRRTRFRRPLLGLVSPWHRAPRKNPDRASLCLPDSLSRRSIRDHRPAGARPHSILPKNFVGLCSRLKTESLIGGKQKRALKAATFRLFRKATSRGGERHGNPVRRRIERDRGRAKKEALKACPQAKSRRMPAGCCELYDRKRDRAGDGLTMRASEKENVKWTLLTVTMPLKLPENKEVL